MPQPLLLNCPSCGAAMQVDDQYLAQYGGMTTTCQACQRPFQLPAAPPPGTYAQPGAYPPGAYGQAGTYPQPGGVLNYAGPYQGYPQGPLTMWAKGKELVAAKGAVSPPRCCKCNGPAEYRWTKNMRYIPPMLYFFIGIISLFFSKTGEVTVFLCEAHRKMRTRNILIGVVFGVGGLALAIGSGVFMSESRQNEDVGAIGLLAGIFCALFGLIYGAVTASVVKARLIDDQYLFLRGAKKPFLDSLPQG